MQPIPEPEQQENYPKILEELSHYNQFVTWRYEIVNSRRTKPPIDAVTGKFADVSDPSTWCHLNTALLALQSGRYEGVGFVFTPQDQFVGIDLDHVVHEDGTIEPEAAGIIASLNSYTEISVSGTGIHIIAKGGLAEGGRKHRGVEMYDRERYFTLSFNHLPGTPETIMERPEQVQQLYESLSPPRHENPHPVFSPTGTDQDILEKAMNAKNSGRFMQLWHGDTTGFKSRSEADFTFFLRMFYWGASPEQAIRLYKQSGLYEQEGRRGTDKYIYRTAMNALKKRQR